MLIVHNGTCTMHCNVVTDVRIAKETGYDGIEIVGSKLYSYLAQGFTIDDLKKQLDGFPVIALGFIPDIERSDPQGQKDLMQEAERMIVSAEQLGCNFVQVLTGPIDPTGASEEYKKTLSLSYPELRTITAKNLVAIADLGARHNVKFYLEPLNWCPLCTLQHILDLIDEVGRDNLGMVIDFWHMWDTGATAEDFAKLDKNLIYGVHICDSLEPHNQRGTAEGHGRRVWTGGGNVPLKIWIDAIRSTGFDGWFSGELFSPKHWELDPWKTANLLRDQMEYLLV